MGLLLRADSQIVPQLNAGFQVIFGNSDKDLCVALLIEVMLRLRSRKDPECAF